VLGKGLVADGQAEGDADEGGVIELNARAFVAVVDEDVDDVLDQISLEVEVAMSAALVVGSRTLPAQLQTTSKEMIGDHESQVGIVRLLYLVTYVTAENTPDILE
jgi:hypothetical protein